MSTNPMVRDAPVTHEPRRTRRRSSWPLFLLIAVGLFLVLYMVAAWNDNRVGPAPRGASRWPDNLEMRDPNRTAPDQGGTEESGR